MTKQPLLLNYVLYMAFGMHSKISARFLKMNILFHESTAVALCHYRALHQTQLGETTFWTELIRCIKVKS